MKAVFATAILAATVGAVKATLEPSAVVSLALEYDQEAHYDNPATMARLFQDYKKAYEVSIPVGEESTRQMYFAEAVKRVVRLRNNSQFPEQRAQYGLNHLAHLSTEEIQNLIPIRTSSSSEYADDDQHHRSACEKPEYLEALNRLIQKRKHALTDDVDDSEERDAENVDDEESREFAAAGLVVEKRRLRHQHRQEASVGSERAQVYGRKVDALGLPATAWPDYTVQHQNCLTRVRKQHLPYVPGACGSCWSHGAVGALEIALCVAKQNTTAEERNEQLNFAYEDKRHTQLLSVQEILDCSSSDDSGTSGFGGENANHACHGGQEQTAWNMVMATGLRSQEDFPGEGDHYDDDAFSRCIEVRAQQSPSLYPAWMPPRSTTDEGRDIYKLDGFLMYPNLQASQTKFVWPNNTSEESLWPTDLNDFREFIKKGVREHGAVSVSIQTIYENFIAMADWQNIYYPTVEECVGKVKLNTDEVTAITDHCVNVVGYGQENGRNYFWVKNSWSKYFGDGGYYKVSADHCDNFQGPLGKGTYFKMPTITTIQRV